MHIYRYIILLCCLSIALPGAAQEIKVKSFRHLPADITAIIQGTTYQDKFGETASLIRMVTPIQLSYDTGETNMLVVKSANHLADMGEIWVWVSRRTRKLNIYGDGTMAPLRGYHLPMELEPGGVYELVLDVPVAKVLADQFLVMSVSPAEAQVYINDTLQTHTGGDLIKRLRVGKYVYRVEASGYETAQGSFDIVAEQPIKVEVTLQSSLKSKIFTVKGVSFTMIPVEGGTFTMGATSEQGRDADDDEKPAHRVTLSDYYIGETEVTQGLWEAVMGTTISLQRYICNSNIGEPPLYGVGENFPMYYVSWDDSQKFIKKLNALTGKNFRLPTEAEWEYAARGGNKSKGYKYAGSNTIGDVAWYTDNSNSITHLVGRKAPNELGLYDMSGNVWEYCSDWFGSYSVSAQPNPIGPISGWDRVIRGGSWHDYTTDCRVSTRGIDIFGVRFNCINYGFRLALTK